MPGVSQTISNNCNFCDQCFSGLLRDRIVSGIRSDKVRRSLLAEKNLDLNKTLEKCRAYEVASEGMETLKKADQSHVERIGASANKEYYNKNRNFSYRSSNNMNQGKDDVIVCKFCLREHPFGRKYCKAWGKRCEDCGIMKKF